ncbi:hypothetical protein GI374_07320 [Paracoccus sp. S-4012]|uniref:hypothetical protein n=1 Tax=Paracoccus sp. S-4012 TaxID=2665648 RepID=UPI0012AF457F|nr:hypothetical protein [Paracoccus sp. S-4012]MRX50258.1 hypothetical protein [Paracoccus sp. S-4012]
MTRRARPFQPFVAAIFCAFGLAVPAAGQEAPATPPAEATTDLDALFAALKAPGEGWRGAEADILRAWSRSGSASIDYLRQRGEAALDAGDLAAAIGHLTALTDHAPDYAPGFQLRAAAYAFAGEFGPAAADLARALTLEPRNFLALTQLGAMLEEIGNTEAALDAFEVSLAIHPHQQEALDAVARLTRALGGTAI